MRHSTAPSAIPGDDAGIIKKTMTGGVDRDLTDGEKIVAGIGSGAASGIVRSHHAHRQSRATVTCRSIRKRLTNPGRRDSRTQVCGPMELIMIQQQRKGTGLIETTVNMIKGGPSTFFRGVAASTVATIATIARTVCIARTTREPSQRLHVILPHSPDPRHRRIILRHVRHPCRRHGRDDGERRHLRRRLPRLDARDSGVGEVQYTSIEIQ